MSEALNNSFAAGDVLNNSFDVVDTGGEGGLVDLSTVETVAATAVGGGEVLSVNSASHDSSDVEESDESAPLFGVEVLNGRFDRRVATVIRRTPQKKPSHTWCVDIIVVEGVSVW